MAMEKEGQQVFGDKWVERDVAIEIMAKKIGICARNSYTATAPDEIQRLEEERQELLRERDAMYQGDNTVLQKILEVYAADLRTYYVQVKQHG